MGIKNFLAQEFRNPSGIFGRILGRDMNFGHQRLYKWALDISNIKLDDTILDIGCGGGKFVKMLSDLAPDGKVIGVDYSKAMVQLATRVNKNSIQIGQVEIKHASVSSLPFSDNTFDLITAIETFYFWPDKINDLKEVLRMLKPGGSFIMVLEMFYHKNISKMYLRLAKMMKTPLYTINNLKSFLSASNFENIEALVNRNNVAMQARKKFY